jgi:tetratricopeptide (TPR) repeat protein
LAAAIASEEGEEALAGEWNAKARARGRFLEPPNPWLEASFEFCFLPYALEIQGSLLRERYRHEEAIALLLRAIQIAPKEEGLHFELGNAYYETGNGEATLAAYREALRLRPSFAAVYPALAQATERFGGLEKMERLFRDGLKALPDFYYLPLQVAEIELRRDRPDKAIDLFKRAVRLNPLEIAAWKGYAESARLLDRREAFLNALDGLLSHFPNEASVVPFVGNAFIRLQAWERMDALYAKSAIPATQGASAILEEANAALREDDLWTGYRRLRQVLARDPLNATALFNLGNLYCNYGACERGLDLFETLYSSLRLAPLALRWRAAQSLARAAATSGKYDRGHEVLDEALQMLEEMPGDTSEHKATLDDLYLLLMDAESSLTPDS